MNYLTTQQCMKANLQHVGGLPYTATNSVCTESTSQVGRSLWRVLARVLLLIEATARALLHAF